MAPTEILVSIRLGTALAAAVGLRLLVVLWRGLKPRSSRAAGTGT
jgi:hypothetical protein